MLTAAAKLIPSAVRSMVRTPVFGVVVIAVSPAMYGWIRGHDDFSMTVTFAALVGASALGFAVDDPAENTLIPCPTTRAVRRFVRALLIAVAVSASWIVVAFAVRGADFVLGPVRPWLAQIAAVGALALAFGSILARDGSDRAGLPAAIGAIIAAVASTGLSPFLPWLPMVGVPQHTGRWWFVASLAILATWWWSRDPASRIPPVTRLPKPSLSRARM